MKENKITEKWRPTGLLDDLPNEITCDRVAEKLEEAGQYLITITDKDDLLVGIVLPSIRKVYGTLGCSGMYPTAKWLVDDCKKFMEKHKELLKELVENSYIALDGEAEFTWLYCKDVLKRI
jgi:hypothetical protein